MSILSHSREQQRAKIPCYDSVSDDVLAQLAATDRQAFSIFYVRYADRVFRHCYRRLGTREAAEDATSQVFTLALAAIDRFDPRRGTLASWVFTIANNVLVDHYRTERRYLPESTSYERADLADTPEEIALARERASGLHRALRELAPREREVIELRLAGLSSADISDVLGCQRNAVAQTQFRALGRLRTMLGAAPACKGKRNV